MEIKVVYVPRIYEKYDSHDEYIPTADWGVLEEDGRVRKYRLRDMSIIDGVPFAEFKESKHITNNKSHFDFDIIKELVTREPIPDYFTEKPLTKEIIIRAINDGYLIPFDGHPHRLSAQVNKSGNKYEHYIKVEYPMYQYEETHLRGNYYEDYDTAFAQAEAMVAEKEERIYRQREEDFQYTMDWVRDKLPEDKKHMVETFKLLPHYRGFCMRVYKGKVLYCAGVNDIFHEIYDIEQEVS